MERSSNDTMTGRHGERGRNPTAASSPEMAPGSAAVALRRIRRWVHVVSFAVAGLFLLIPNGEYETRPWYGMALLAYAGWIATGRGYIWVTLFYLFPIVGVIVVLR